MQLAPAARSSSAKQKWLLCGFIDKCRIAHVVGRVREACHGKSLKVVFHAYSTPKYWCALCLHVPGPSLL